MPDITAETKTFAIPEKGVVRIFLEARVATIRFGHRKGNSLPAAMLHDLTAAFDGLARDPESDVIVLRSEGSGAFCAGASFDELKGIRTAEQGTEFFSGFARLMLAMMRCPKPILARVQGKTAGGGVGIVAAADYVFALPAACVKLSELALGIGPFVVGPVIAHRIGNAAFSAMALDTEWRDAAWCARTGLFTRVLDTEAAVDSVLPAVANRLTSFNPAALAELKRATWEGSEQWEELLFERAAVSGRLVLSQHTRDAIAAFEQRAK